VKRSREVLNIFRKPLYWLLCLSCACFCRRRGGVFLLKVISYQVALPVLERPKRVQPFCADCTWAKVNQRSRVCHFPYFLCFSPTTVNRITELECGVKFLSTANFSFADFIHFQAKATVLFWPVLFLSITSL